VKEARNIRAKYLKNEGGVTMTRTRTRVATLFVVLSFAAAGLWLWSMEDFNAGLTHSVVFAEESRGEVTESERQFVLSPEGNQAVIAKIPQSLSPADKAALTQLINQSMNALRAGDGATSLRALRKVQTIAKKAGGGIGPLTTCGDFCQHHLDEGNAPAYAVCYYACVLKGGPGPRVFKK
jgi:hypothetical protein